MTQPLDRDSLLQRIQDHGGPEGLDLSGHNLAGADLSGLDLHGISLARANLREADLRWANLQGADLSRASLQTADLRWSDFQGANLRQADLRGSNLWGAELTGADLSGTDLQDAHLIGAALNQAAAQAIARTGRGIPGMPTITPAGHLPDWLRTRITLGNVSIVVGVTALLIYVWGWIYQASYYGEFGISPADAMDLVSASYLLQGWGVVAISARFLLMLPLLLVYGLLMLVLLLVVPLLFILIGDRLLAQVDNEALRRAIVVVLFLGYLASFLFIFPRLLPLWNLLTTRALPGRESVTVMRDLIGAGSALERLLILGGIVIAAIPVWIGYRLLARAIQESRLPAQLTARHPRLDGALTGLKQSRLFERSTPLTQRERSLGLVAVLALLIVIPTLFTQAGAAHAQEDMCSGGQLTQVTLYSRSFLQTSGTAVEGFNEVQACLRLLLFRNDLYYVFFPFQTRIIEGRRQPVVYQIPNTEASLTYHRDIRTCLTCLDTEQLPLSPQSPIVFPTPTLPPTWTPTAGPSNTPLPTNTAIPTNTPIPTSTIVPSITPSPSPTLTPVTFDVYEPDDTAEQAQWIGIGETQNHNFYPEDDIDILKFNIKQDRWYRVTTSNLAIGVDTTIIIGAKTTFCEPENCRNDDIAPGTLASEVVFQSAGDGVAFITVTNRGQYDPDKTYDITVVELLPTATPTATYTPSPTRTATPTWTLTPSRTPTGVPLPTITRTLRPTPVGQGTPTATGTPPTPTPTLTATPTPRGPTNLACTILSEQSVRLTWSNPPAPDSENWFEYWIGRRVVGGDWPDEPAAKVPAPGNSYVDDNLSAGTAYEYRVRGYRPATDTFSDYSNTVACQPFTPTPTITPLVTATPTPTNTATPAPTGTPTPTETASPSTPP
jgi:hypothetical protein